MRNMIVDYRGGAKSRAGTALVQQALQLPSNGRPPRVIGWQFNNQQGYVLEWGDGYLRFHFQGATVTETPIAVTAVTQANPAVVSAANAFSPGDWVVFAGIGGMTILNANTYTVGAGVTGTTIPLDDLYGNPINSTGYPAFTSGGTIARIYQIASPYSVGDLTYLKFTQSADVMSLCLVDPDTGNEYAPYDLKRFGPTNWTLTPTVFASTVAAPGSCSVTATVQPGAGSPPTLPAAYAYVMTKVDVTTGEESLPSPIGNVVNGVDMAATAGSNIINWGAVGGAGYYNIYRAPTSYNTDPGSPTVALPVPIGANFYRIGSAFGTQFVDSNIVADFSTSPPQHTDPFAPGQILGLNITGSTSDFTTATAVITTSTGSGAAIELVISPTPTGAVVAAIMINNGQNYALTDTVAITGTGTSATATLQFGPATGTYPALVSYFQDRRTYAQTLNAPDAYFMSKPGAFTNFDVSNPVNDSDAITGTPSVEKVDGIQWMLTMPLGLLTFTGSGVYQVGAPGSYASSPAAITPANQIAFPQSSIGSSSHVPPQRINWDVLYVEPSDNNVLDLSYQIFFNIYAGTDISWPATHLLAPHAIRDWAYARSPDRVQWIVLDNGQLLSLTYLKEQEIAGWSRHDTLGQFRSLCSIKEQLMPITQPASIVDAVYFVVERPAPGGTRYFIERMNNRIWDTLEDTWSVDCAVANEQTTGGVPSVLYANSISGAVTFTAAQTGTFATVAPGGIMRMGGGIAVIAAQVSSTVLTGNWVYPCQQVYPNDPQNRPLPQAAGSWTLSTPVTSVDGLQHLVGQNVSGLADGVPVGIDPALQPIFPYLPPQSFGLLVPNSLGQVTLPFAASAVVLGLGFTAQLQSVYLNAGQPTIQGRRKMVYAATARVAASALCQIGANQTDASTVPPTIAVNWSAATGMTVPQLQFLDPPAPAAYTTPAGVSAQPLFSSDMRALIPAIPRKPGQVAVQQILPYPLNVTSFIPEFQEGDAVEAQLPARQQPQRNGP